jgi:outer membrane protein
MKRILVGAAAGLTALTISTAAPLAAQKATPARPAAAAAAAKVAYIDSRQIREGMPAYAQADSTFQRELATIRNDVQALTRSYDSARTAFDQSSVVLSGAQRDARQKELTDLRTRSEQRAAQLQEQAARRYQELLGPLHQRIEQAIEAERAAGGFALVFDVGSEGSSIVAADKTLDLTQKVIQRLGGTK